MACPYKRRPCRGRPLCLPFVGSREAKNSQPLRVRSTGRGVVPIIDYLAAIRDTGFDQTVSIELEYSPEPDRIVEWVQEAYQKTAEMMDALGCRG